jgi:hypothetical protein
MLTVVGADVGEKRRKKVKRLTVGQGREYALLETPFAMSELRDVF